MIIERPGTRPPHQPQVVMMVAPEPDPEEIAERRAWRERSDRNFAWLQEHAATVYAQYRGKCVCIAGEELFTGSTPAEALAAARAAHPNDDGYFLHYVPLVRRPRV